jgi:palmitoyltransferase
MCLDPGTAPQQWVEEHEEDESLQRCRKSNLPKPPRAHYCSVTRRLVLNMDHFCPWVVNTVGFYNRKFFVLFLLYTCVTIAVFIGSAVFDLATSKESVTVDGIFNLYMALLLDAGILLCLGGFLGFHMYLVINNKTTIEMDTEKFNVGARANIEQVFGSDPWIWFLPIYGHGPNGDGLNWPMACAYSSESDPLNAPQDDHIVGIHDVELELGALPEVRSRPCLPNSWNVNTDNTHVACFFN